VYATVNIHNPLTVLGLLCFGTPPK